MNVNRTLYDSVRRRLPSLPSWDGRWRDVKDLREVMHLAHESGQTDHCRQLWLEVVATSVLPDRLVDVGLALINEASAAIGRCYGQRWNDKAGNPLWGMAAAYKQIGEASSRLRHLSQMDATDRRKVRQGGPKAHALLEGVFALPYQLNFGALPFDDIFKRVSEAGTSFHLGPVGYDQVFYPDIVAEGYPLRLAWTFHPDAHLTGRVTERGQNWIGDRQLWASAKGVPRTRIYAGDRDYSALTGRLKLTQYDACSEFDARLGALNYRLV